jgi:hypothetical protein
MHRNANVCGFMPASPACRHQAETCLLQHVAHRLTVVARGFFLCPFLRGDGLLDRAISVEQRSSRLHRATRSTIKRVHSSPYLAHIRSISPVSGTGGLEGYHLTIVSVRARPSLTRIAIWRASKRS